MANVVLLLLLITVIAAAGATATAVSLDHVVGGSFGWHLPPNETFYQQWTKGRTFAVGDRLVFTYTPALENVVEVSEKDFGDCTQTKVVGMYYSGQTVLEITKPGPRFYFCGVGTHCERGQKLSIHASAAQQQRTAAAGEAS